MTVQQAILTAMEDILGLDQEEMRDQLDLDLFENDLVDSLGLVTLINEVSGHIGHPIDVRRMPPEDLATVRRMTAAIEAQIG